MTADRHTLEITGIGSQGDGIAETADGTVHVPRALPGEVYAIAGGQEPEIVGPPSPHRRENMLCPHFPACGGCALQHMDERTYRTWKAGLLGEALAQRGLNPTIEPLSSVPLHSRRRATLTGRWDRGEFALGFNSPGSHDIVPLEACAVLTPGIVKALPDLSALTSEVCDKKQSARVAVLDTGASLDVSIETGSRRLEKLTEAAIASAKRAGVGRLTVNATPTYLVTPPSLDMAGTAVIPPPGAFLQAAAACENAMGAAVSAAVSKARNVADLFCGVGTFALRIARLARVTAIDSDRTLTDALAASARMAQGLKPIEIITRNLFRDPLSPNELRRFDAVVLDPPRAGARSQAEALTAARVPTVVMVSCNPATLARDLKTLVDGGYRIELSKPFDQFLYTSHLEAVVVLRRAKQ